MNIAIFSPNKNPYSETFIQAHKQYLKGKVYYYYGSKSTMRLEGYKLISSIKRLRLRIERILFGYSVSEIHNRAILSSLKTQGIDTILVEYGNHAYHLRSVLRDSKIPFVVHFHGYDASVTKVINECEQYKEVFAFASKIVAVSNQMKQKLLMMGCPEDKLVYNVYGPQSEFESVRPTYSSKQFVSIGRFTDKKAPYFTIMAFKNVLNKHPDARLLLAGDGPLLNMCKNLVSHFGMSNQVHFLGVISPDEFRNILSESLAYVQHSITADSGDMEGTPLAILESSIAGLAVISTNHAGISDVIIDEETGLLCEEQDVAGMSANMLTLLDNVDLARQMGSLGKKHISQQFNISRHIQLLQENLEAITKM